MKIAFPTQEKNDKQSPVHNHCQPLVALGGTQVDAVVVGGIGGGALRKLLNAGIKAYRAVEGTVLENLALANNDKLDEFSPEHTCQGHHHGIGECVH